MRAFVGSLGLFALVNATGCGSPPASIAGPPERGLVGQLSKDEAKTAGAKSTSKNAGSPVDPAFFRAYAETRGFRLGTPNHRTPTPDGNAVLFLRASKRDPRQALYEVDAKTGAERVVIAPDDVAKGAESISAEEKARRERLRVVATGFTDFELSKDGSQILVSLSGKLLMVARATGTFEELQTGTSAAIDPHLSPDASKVAFVENDDVFILPTSGGAKKGARAVTKGGSEDRTHGLADFIAGEELDRSRGFWWAPDGQMMVFEESDTKNVDHLSLVDPGHPDRAVDRVAYPRPGKTNADVRLGLAAVNGDGAHPTWIEWDRAAFPYVARVVWEKDAPPLLYVLDRAQQNGNLLAVDAKTGKTRLVLSEHDNVFLNVDPSVPAMMPDGKRFFWSSERSGTRLPYLADLANGALTPLAAPGKLGFRRLAGIDASGVTALVEASDEPTEQHVFALTLDGKGAPRQLDHGKWSGASDSARSGSGKSAASQTVSLSEASLDGPVSYPLTTAEGAKLATLSNQSEAPSFVPTTHLESVGADLVRVAVTVPRTFDKARTYAVIDAAYAGPHVSVAQARREAFVFDQVVADSADAIVVSIDARGTPDRGRDWERAIAGKLAEVPLEGHVAALKALFAIHPEMDADRVGVFGWSFGGYFSALAVLKHPEMYKVAVAGAPVVDWRDYDTAYTERYLGVPPADGKSAAYDASSILTYADRPVDAEHPARPLLLIHGTSDDNVYFLNSLRLTTALERAHRPFVFYPLVGVTHMPIDPTLSEAMWTKVATYLSTNLQK